MIIRQEQSHYFIEPKKKAIEQEKILNFPVFMLILLITSTFYVVPLSRVDYFGTDLRLFDLVFILFFLTVGLRKWPEVIGLFKTKNQIFW